MDRNAELIIAIVNQGNTDLVMEGAKAAGATGGTFFHGFGTTNKENAKFFGIPFNPEKDLVFILVNPKIKDAVLDNIYKYAGLQSKATGVVFSIAVENVLGADMLFKTTDGKEKKK